MTVNKNMPSIAPIPPHSRMFSRGSLGSDIDGRSKEGKFIRKCEAELARHVGGAPNFAQRLLLRRISRSMLRLELLDTKMSSGDWTAYDAREFNALSNTVRLGIRELGLKPTIVERAPTLDEIAARYRREVAAP